VALDQAELDQLEELNVLYTSARYPDDWGLRPEGQPDPTQIESYLVFAQNLLRTL
jgi:hypothetical protein